MRSSTFTKQRLLTLLMYVTIAFLSSFNSYGQSTWYQTKDYEPLTGTSGTNYGVSGGAVISATTTAGTFRTGSTAINHTPGSTTARYWYNNNIGVFPNVTSGTVHLIYWAKAVLNTASSVTSTPTVRYYTSPTQAAPSSGGAGTAVTLNGSTWTRCAQAYTINNATRVYVAAPNTASVGNGTGVVYYDDIIMYYDGVSATTDLTAPSSGPSSLTNSGLAISWTNGSDAGTGVQGSIVLVSTNAAAAAPTLLDQGHYPAGASVGADWTVATNTTSTSWTITGTPAKVAVINYDKAYNYSTAGTISITVGSASPTLTAAIGATVDNDINITFTDNASWRAAVTAVSVNGTVLTASTDYVLSSGQLTLKPSGGNAVLRSSGSKAVAILATGYSLAEVTQPVGVGAASKLGVTTQPSALYNGFALGTQPVVAIQDQYGNTTSSTANVTVSVGSGSFTLNGTTTVAAVNGVATFSGLTVTAASAITGATLSFSSSSFTGTTSNAFNIAAPEFLSISTRGLPAVENFNSMGTASSTSISAIVPSGIHLNTAGEWQGGSGTITTSTIGSYGSTGSNAMTTSSSGGTHNIADGVNATSTDRALAIWTSGSYSNGRSIILRVKNNTGATITDLKVNFDYEKYRENTTSLTFNFFHGSNGSTWTADANGDNSWAGGTAAVINPPTTTSKAISLTGLNIANGGDYYFKWTFNASAATNSQAVAIDNVSLLVPFTPVLAATTMTNVRIDSARATSTVLSDGGFTILERGFVYGNNFDPTTDDNKLPDAANTAGSMTTLLEYLSANTTYYVRSFATNELGTAYGVSQSFTTLDYPVLTTTAVSSVTSAFANSGGEITSDGGAAITERGVVYGTSANPTTADTKVIDGSTGTGSFTSNMAPLNRATTYYVRAYATNIIGTFYGQEETFTTLANAPAVTTASISSVTGVSATSGGNVSDDGGDAITERGIVYSTSPLPTIADTKIIDVAPGTGVFSASLTGLTNGTTYYVRAYAINTVGTSYGSQESFTTLDKPTVTTTASSFVTSSSVATGGNVTADGGDPITERGVVYSTSSNPTTANTKVTDATASTGSFSSNITGLTSNTTYYVRAYAINSTGTSYGADETFTTTSGATAPTVSTASVTNLGSSTVTVGGTLSSDGGDAITERGIVYSASVDPTTADTKIADASTAIGSFSTGITGLTPGATYHVRAYAINSIGTSYGSDVSFTMNPVLATVTTTAASSVGQTTASTGGDVTYDGGAAITERGVVYGTTTDPTTSNTKVVDGSTGTGSFTSSLTGLVGVTTYYVRAYAINAAGTSYGSNESFTTLASAPIVTTTAVTSISGSTANTGGNVTADGGDPITERGVVYSTSSNPTIADTKVIDASVTTGSFTSSLSGLSPLTTYYIRAYATNGIGTSYGSEVSFTTISVQPTVQASAVSFTNITFSGMTINFTAGDGANSIVVVKESSAVNATPANTFSYTANTIFGSGSQLGTGNYVVYIGSGNSVDITGLVAGTTYHVAVYTFNGNSGTENYLTAAGATGNQATSNYNYRSIASGNWSSPAIWESYDGSTWSAAADFPISTKGTITIQAGHTVALDTTISVDEMTIAATAQVTINATKTMTVANGNGTDLTVNGYLKNQGTITLSSSPSITVAGTYEHAVNGGVVPAATWSTGSTCLVTGVTSTMATGFSQTFYNLTYNCPSQSASLNMGMYNTTINGDFNFLNGGAGSQETGLSLAGAGVGPNNVITIQGNFNVNSSVNTNQICAHRSGSASTVTNMTVNIQGNLNITNGSLFLARNTGIATLNWNLYGNLNMTGGVFNSSHTAALFHFAKSGTQSFSKTAGTMTAANIVIDGTSTVDAGTSAFDGTATLTISAGATLISANASGSITTTGTKTLNAAANYVFNGAVAQTTNTSLTAANNITLNNSLGLTLGASTAVTGTMTLTSGKVTLGANTLTLTNELSGASSSNYVVTSGAGLLKYLAVGSSGRTYNIGNSASNYTPFTLTNNGTTSDIGVGVSATITNSLFSAAKAVGLQWTVNSATAGATANMTFNWNVANEGASFSNTSEGFLGQYVSPGPYSVSSLGTLSGTSVSKSGVSLGTGSTLFVIGNKNSIFVPQIVGFDVSTLTGGSGSFGASPYTATTLNANLSSSGLVRGSGLTTTGTAASGGWGAGGGYNSSTSATAITGNKFITFTVKPNSGYSTELLSLNPISYRTSSSGPNAILIQYQINTGAFVDLLSTSLTLNTTAGQVGSIDLSSIAALQNVQSNETVTFRLVPFGASSATGTFYINNVNASVASDLAVNGNVNACSIYSDAPVITSSPICAGATTVSGTSTEANGTVIDLYIDGTWNQFVTVAGGAWSATVPPLTAGKALTAYASAPGECLSNVSSTVTVGAPTSSTTNVSVCSVTLPYSWNGNSYSSAGTYTANFTNAVGCDSAAILVLTVNNGTFTSTTASVCDTYTWSANGQTYTTSGDYIREYNNSNGCPSADTLHLTITASTSNTTTESVCDSYTWSVNGQTYTTSGSYTSVSGCHSEILNLTITASTSNTTSESVCDSYTWSVNGQTYTTSGSYTSVSGCHSEILNLTITASTSNTTTESACDSYTWSVNGQTYTTSGSYTSVSGCATEILDLTITASTSNTTTESVCDSYTWSVNGQTYTTSGSYTSVSGCHSEILDLSITSSSTNITTESVCDSYTWVDGQSYTSSGSYTYVSGCATEILNLTIIASTSNTTTESVCDSYTWSVNGQTYTTSGSYTSVTGCATEILDLTITASTSNSTPVSVCDSYTWSANGQTYTTSGSYTSVSGCATEILNLTITASTSNSTPVSVCNSYTWSVNGQTYTTSGSYTSVSGCATEILDLTIKQSNSSSTPVIICASQVPYSWNGGSYSESGTYSFSTTNVAGCDSVATLVLTVSASIPNPVASVTQPSCATATGTITVTSPLGAGLQYSIGGAYQSSTIFSGVAAGTYSLTAQSGSGCNSSPTSVTVNAQPAVPGATTIAGQVNVCNVVGTNNAVSYTATAQGATTYTWTLPPNTTLVSGQGTSTISVKFLSGFTTQVNKQLRVVASSVCGSSALKIFQLTAQYPTTPSTIIASTSNVCPSIGTGVPITYRVPKVGGAASYIWSAQSGTTTITHPNGLGENDTLITVTFASNFTSSSITVQTTNDCGTSAIRSIFVSRNNPTAPGIISGPTNVCAYSGSTGVDAVYSLNAVSTVDTYTWTLPAGASNISGQGTNTITFRYPAGYTGGSLSVTATNSCGTSAARTLNVTRLLPATPGNIDVINTSGCPNRVYTYSIAAMPSNTVSLEWTVPAGGQIVSGQGTRTIAVSYSSGVVDGVVSVRGISNCGASSYKYSIVKLAPCPAGPAAPMTKGLPTVANNPMEVKVFPNPTTSNFNLQVITADQQEVVVRILDVQGRFIKSVKVAPYQTLNIGSELKSGSYLVEVKQGNSLKTTRVVKY